MVHRFAKISPSPLYGIHIMYTDLSTTEAALEIGDYMIRYVCFTHAHAHTLHTLSLSRAQYVPVFSGRR